MDKGKAKARASTSPSPRPTASRPSSSTPPRSPDSDSQGATEDEDEEEEEAEWCLICHASPIADRTVLPGCLHAQFCFSCIVRWVGIKRRCPLCLADVGDYLIHAVRADDDYMRYHLPPPLPPSSTTATARFAPAPSRRAVVAQVQAARARRNPSRSASVAAAEEEEEVERALERRRYVYRNGLYAKHVGSNRHTQYRACPTPAQIRRSPDTARRIRLFLRRELSVWPQLDAEFLVTYMLSLLQVFSVDADETVRLTSEFLGERTARHVLHELECFLRSGKRELRFYDHSPHLQYPPAPPPPPPASAPAPAPVTPKGRQAATQDTDIPADAARSDVARRRKVLLSRLERERAQLDTSYDAAK